ncbi:hypothetical protein DSO57_1012737, partial [Entomophthora muscae]
PIVYEQKLSYQLPNSIPNLYPFHSAPKNKSCSVFLNSGIPDGLLVTYSSQDLRSSS